MNHEWNDPHKQGMVSGWSGDRPLCIVYICCVLIYLINDIYNIGGAMWDGPFCSTIYHRALAEVYKLHKELIGVER